ncbi:hypothetical protein ACIP17_16095 [Streptomyces iakyrus]|uniref:hypothetical protein n=1 Tax=Streptomyces iakyrus TaxID=68219 RepID=UPI0037F44D52
MPALIRTRRLLFTSGLLAVALAMSGGAGGALPDGTFGAIQDVVVQEIQAVNR